jgi:hypothetical protein
MSVVGSSSVASFVNQEGESQTKARQAYLPFRASLIFLISDDKLALTLSTVFFVKEISGNF